ncbi:hypothetical protein [Halomicronema sp. CCY15110]|uniref:hypothetical protein n=1 Tax=Halomicronema sp. CCY15110 TaxID=2767773 RepID=UPI00194ED9AE|nr:hypothetical protein [Halomicronema sp. CCY15110]
MKIVSQTTTELRLQSSVNRQRLVLPAVMLGVVVVGLGIAVVAGAVNIPLLLILGLVGGLGGTILNDECKSEVLTLDRGTDQIQCDRKTLWGTQQWQWPLSTLQDVSVVTRQRRRKKANGNQGTQWFYSIQFVAQGQAPQELLYSHDGDRVNATYRTIHDFLKATQAQTHLPSGRGTGLNITSDYERWRQTMFTRSPEQAGGVSAERDRVYGVLMDVGMVDSSTSQLWAISMSAWLSGEADFFPTPGGAVIGLGSEPQVAEAAQTILQLAQTARADASRLPDQALPDQPDLVQFWLFTPGGVYGVADMLQRLRVPSNAWGQMFQQFSLIRQVAEQQLEQR